MDDPQKRIKDFTDIVELISGLVETGTHFNMEALWRKISSCPEAREIKEMLKQMSSENSTEWDIEDVRSQLVLRNFTNDYIDETLITRIKDFYELLD